MSSHLYKLLTLSVMEPWASLIIKFGKDVENRTWHTPYCVPLLIHASKKVDLDKDNYSITSCYQRAWDSLHFDLARRGIRRLPSLFVDLDINPGHILGYVWLEGCGKTNPSPWAFTGNYHWILKNPILFKGSFPARGQLGLYDTVIPIDDSDPKRAAAFAPYRCSSSAAVGQ